LGASRALDVDVDSAVTGDYQIGEPPDSQRAAMQRGIDLSGLRAKATRGLI
jgi:protein-tyrosine-phosphatase